ncbi:MAG: YciI family protein, partial [Acidobacteria bacterium]|nr:YciI family protein [Acidobacteriota bacterium]
PEELGPLRELESELPPELESRGAQELRDQGLIVTDASTPRRTWQTLRKLAAALLLFAAGAFSHILLSQTPKPAPGAAKSRYVLLLRSPSDLVLSVEERAKRTEEYSAWARELRNAGKLELGERLADATQILGSPRDSAFGDARERLTGLFVVRVATYQEALQVARSCPFLTHGGRIELRLIEPT